MLMVAVSSSVMAMFCESVVPRVKPADGLEIVSVAVSVASTITSFWTVKVTVPVVWPLRIVMMVFESV